MNTKKHRRRCYFCGGSCDLSIKAPLGDPIPTCEVHVGKARAIAQDATDRNGYVLDMLADPQSKRKALWLIAQYGRPRNLKSVVGRVNVVEPRKTPPPSQVSDEFRARFAKYMLEYYASRNDMRV